MSRYLGIVDDPTSGGSTLDVLKTSGATIAAPTLFLPVSTAQVEPGEMQLDREDEVTGQGGVRKPVAFQAMPTVTWECRAYAKQLRPIIRKALSGTVTPTGTAPAAIASTIAPALSPTPLKTSIVWLMREEMLDRLTGVAIEEFALNFPIDQEGQMTVNGRALYHQTDDSTGTYVDPSGTNGIASPTPTLSGFDETFKLRDAVAYRGDSLTEITNLAGFGLTYNVGMITEQRSLFGPNKNIRSVNLDGLRSKVWFPKRHRYSRRRITGRIDLSSVDALMDFKKVVRQSEKLVFEVAAGPLATTPASDEMLRITLYNSALNGGNAEPIQAEGDQFASYEFGGYVDSLAKDLEITMTGTTALS